MFVGGVGLQIQAEFEDIHSPQGSKVPKYGVSMVSVFGSVIMVCGIYIMFGYLDP